MKVAVIGAGVAGRLAALSLIDQGHQVTVLDRKPIQQPDNAAWVSAGMLCPTTEAIHAPEQLRPWFLGSHKRWQQVLHRLKKLAPRAEQPWLQQRGAWLVAFPQEAALFQQWQQDIARLGLANESVRWFKGEALADRNPGLNRFHQAAYFPHEGQLDQRAFLNASAEALHLYAHCMTQQVDEARCKSLQKEFDWVLDCRGALASAEQFSENTKAVRGVRGEIIRVHAPNVPLKEPVRVVHPRHSLYIAPKPGGLFVIGATEIETNDASPITVRSTLALMSVLYSVHEGFADATLIETNVGLRPATPDHLPTFTRHNNLITVNGLYRHGWLIGPAVVEQALTLMEVKHALTD